MARRGIKALAGGPTELPPLDAHESLAGMTNAGGCFVVAPGEGRLIDLGEFELRVEADAGTTCGVVSVLEATEPPGFGPPIHIHDDAAEAFYVLEVEYVMNLDGDERSCPAGTLIFVPEGVPHGFRVGAVPSRKLNFCFPQR